MNEVKHPFFHVMVVMSGALVGCGGEALDTGKPIDGVGGIATNDSGGNGAGDGGGTAPSGGSSGDSGGSGGAIASGGSAQATGGSIAHGGTAVPPDLGCPPAQWACDEESAMYVEDTVTGSFEGYTMPNGCECDEERPVSPTDCQLGEQFTCWRMAFLDEKTAFDQVYPLSCECLTSPHRCSETCLDLTQITYRFADGFFCGTDAQEVTLCGEGFVFLK